MNKWMTLQNLRDHLRGRKAAYQRIPRPALEDLAFFCRANETTFHENERAQAMLEGRRQVWLRIQQHLNLSSEELMALYKAVAVQNGEPNA